MIRLIRNINDLDVDVPMVASHLHAQLVLGEALLKPCGVWLITANCASMRYGANPCKHSQPLAEMTYVDCSRDLAGLFKAWLSILGAETLSAP